MNDQPENEREIVVLPRRDPLHLFILAAFSSSGRSPSLDEIREQFGWASIAEAEDHVAALEHTGAIHRNPGDASITHAYPFSNEPTAHKVRLADGPEVFAMCAIDALGMPFMLKRDAAIESECSECNAPVRVDIRDGEMAAFQPAAAVVWIAERVEGCVAATDLCPDLNFFCSPDHLSIWKERVGASGDLLSLRQGLERGRAIFGSLMA